MACYRPQRSCEGYVFTGVCLSTRGVSASVHAGIPHTPLEQTPPRADTPPGSRHPHSRHSPGVDIPPGAEPPPKKDGHCCGWCASHWNAFLLPTAMKLGQGNIFTGVCLSTGEMGEGCLPQCMLGCTPRTRQTPPDHRGVGERCLPQCMLGYTPRTRQTPPGPGRPPPDHRGVGEGCLPQCMLGYTPQTRHPPDQADPSPQEADLSIRSTSGRYASYWNAFLFKVNFTHFGGLGLTHRLFVSCVFHDCYGNAQFF